MSLIENITVNGVITPQIVISIIGDGACLFRSISFHLFNTQERFQEIRNTIVLHVADHWEYYKTASYNSNGDNFVTAEEYVREMVISTVYGGICELVAAGNIFPFLFEIYYNNILYANFGISTNPVKRLRLTGHINSGHFDAYLPIDSAINFSTNFSVRENSISVSSDILQTSNNINNAHNINPNSLSNVLSKSNNDVTESVTSNTLGLSISNHLDDTENDTRLVKKRKRRSRCTDRVRNDQVKQAIKKFKVSNPQSKLIAAKKYQENHPEQHREAVAAYQRNNPEVHRQCQNLYEQNHVGIRTENRLRKWKIKKLSGLAYDPMIDYKNDIGSMSEKCKYCQALKWKGETPGMCCNNGKVQLDRLQPPPEPLRSLLKSDHPDHEHFKDRIRKYNGCFQMTSFGGKQIVEAGFMPTFKVQGQVYHMFGSLIPNPNENPQFLQIYFVGEDEKEVKLRCSHYPEVKQALVKQLQNMLHNENKFIRDLKTTLDNVPQNCKNFQVVIRADRKPANGHPGCYNVASSNEVALVIVGQQFEKRDIVIQSHDNKLQRISELHRSYDALQYPLMFCYGEDGYSIDIFQKNPTTKIPLSKTVSASDFYAYRIMIREEMDNYLVQYGSLFSQYLVDMYAKIETEKLNFIRNHQKKLRADNYVHLKDAIGRQDVQANQLGKLVVLPSSFTGGPRYMHEKAQDALTYVRKYGSSDLFITFTCNPKWKEIQEALLPGQKHYHRPDIIARVFNRKVKDLMDLLIKGELFGKVRCHIASIEWQKRGLPHVHILLWLVDRISPDMIDKFVCAEIPNPDEDPLLHEIVTANMMHGPCGILNRNSPCMKDGACSKRYPAMLIQETQRGQDGYPKYRRRSTNDGGFKIRIRSFDLDNRWVVPYNPVLLRTFNAHINVEITSSIKSIKYVCKYVTKGSDQAAFGLGNDIDEIKMYESGRYISSSEAVWRILGFNIHDRYPAITHLDVHLENGQRVYFTEQNIAERLENPPTTTLQGFFQICQTDDFAKTLLYSEVPSYYVWQNNKFIRRKRGQDVEGLPGVKKDSALGRVYTIHPNNVECYHLRLLLHHVKGPISYSFLKTVNNIEYPTFKAACKAFGLLEDDKQWDFALEEAAMCRSPNKMRELFSVILIFCHPADALSLWDKYKNSFSEDIRRQCYRQHAENSITDSEIHNRGLVLIEDCVLNLGGKNLEEYGLPSPKRSGGLLENREYLRETIYDLCALQEIVTKNEQSLTEEQQFVYKEVLNSIEYNSGKLIFLDAPGGTGKTHLINLLLAKVRTTYGIALAAASSGIAATLLEGGKTAHSAFKLPLNLNTIETPTCNISKQSNMAKVLKECKLIVWDESPMSHKKGFEALNNCLKDLKNSNKLMGGVTVLLAGDFRQTLPVIPRGTRANEVAACIKSSHLWPQITKITLTKNMRVHLKGDSTAGQFSELLLKIGDGKYPEFEGKITLPPELGTLVKTLKDLTEKIYPDIKNLNHKSMEWLCERAILTSKNDTAGEINKILLSSFQAETMEYKSVNTVLEVDDAVHYPAEFLNSLNPPGFPPHILTLKIGTPIMLLRNLNPPKLCNGTRLRITALQKNVVEAEIMTGSAKGESVFIPRIPMIPSDYPFQFKRMQFPIKVCFAMTINKSQGQTLKIAGIDVREDCFSHGQFYVACSRVSMPGNLVILAPEEKTSNVVYREVLS